MCRLPGVALVGIAVLVASVTGWTNGQLTAIRQAPSDTAELVYAPPARVLRVMALGYQRALADILWFRTINYFGTHFHTNRVYPWLAHMCDVVTDLDPSAEHVYQFGGVLLPWEAGRVPEGIALLEKGSRNLPDAWRLHYMLGFSYYFFRGDLARAGTSLQRSAELPGAPPFVAELAALVVAAHGGPQTAIAFLSAMEREADNADIRSALRNRIRELQLAAAVDVIDDGVRRFEQQHGRKPHEANELVRSGVLSQLPADPFGGRFELNSETGEVRSSVGGVPRRMGSSAAREAMLSGQQQP